MTLIKEITSPSTGTNESYRGEERKCKRGVNQGGRVSE